MTTVITLAVASYMAFMSYRQMVKGEYPKSIWSILMAIFIAIIALIDYLSILYRISNGA